MCNVMGADTASNIQPAASPGRCTPFSGTLKLRKKVMLPGYKKLFKDINKIDIKDICSSWQWNLFEQKSVVAISCTGDIYLTGKDGTVNWLHTGTAEIIRIANDMKDFEILLNNPKSGHFWGQTVLVEGLISKGKILKENEVYSFKIIPALGGDYSLENFEPTDISVHFALTGQINEQIRNLSDGTVIGDVKII